MLHRLTICMIIAWTFTGIEKVIANPVEPPEVKVFATQSTDGTQFGHGRYGFHIPFEAAAEPLGNPQENTLVAWLRSDQESEEGEDQDKDAEEASNEEEDLPTIAPQPILITGGHIQGNVGTGRNDTPGATGLTEPDYFGIDVALELDDGPWSLLFSYGNQRDDQLLTGPVSVNNLNIESYMLGARYTQKVALFDEEGFSFYLYGQGGVGFFDTELINVAPGSVTVSESRDFDFWAGTGLYVPLNNGLTVGIDVKYHFTEAKLPTGTLNTEGLVYGITLGMNF